jgi:hypothetical protein
MIGQSRSGVHVGDATQGMVEPTRFPAHRNVSGKEIDIVQGGPGIQAGDIGDDQKARAGEKPEADMIVSHMGMLLLDNARDVTARTGTKLGDRLTTVRRVAPLSVEHEHGQARTRLYRDEAITNRGGPDQVGAMTQ